MEKIRLKIKSFDPAILDRFVKQIVVTARSTGATVSGPIPLPTKKTLFAVIRGPHIDKRGQEHFILKVHARLIEISNSTPETLDKISQIDVPPGVDVKVSIK
jgi:ribosomal protein S10, bacterial/organelle